MAKNITIIPASGSINFISSGSSSTIEILITGSNNEILTFYTGSTPILSINSTSGFSTAQPPSFNNLSSVPSSSNYVVYDTGSGAISYTTGVAGSGTSGTSGATGTSGTSGTGSPGTSGTSGNSGTSGISGSSGSSGTSADLSAYVPYTGSTTSVNLGANNLTATAGTFSGTFTVGSNAIYSPSGSTKVSFGTTVQNYQFTLYATGNDNRLHFLNNTTGTAITDGTFMGLDDGINFSFWQRENGYIRFGTNETERLRVTNAGLLTFAGVTSAFPALKRNSTELQVRLADDSGFAPLISGRFEANQTTISINSIATAITNGSFIGANIGGQQFGLLMGTNQSGYSYIQGRYLSAAEHIRIQEFGSGISVGSATGDGYIAIGRTSQLASSRLGIPIAPTASGNYGLVSLGSGAFDGVTAGFFTGVAAGTLIAGNLASGGTSDLINLQVAGANRFKVSSVGQATISGNLVVDTNTLFVDATNDRVGIGDAAPAARLTINSSGGATDLLGLNVAGVRKFRVTSLGVIGFSSNNTSISEGASTGLDFYTNVAPAATQSSFIFAGRTSTNATGESTHFDMGGKNGSSTTGFSRSSGTGTWIGGRLDYTINNTGTYSGTVTGFYLNATETSITGTTHNLLNLLVGGSSRFRVNNAGNVTAAAATFGGTGYVTIGSTSQLASSRLGIPVDPTASANYGLVSLGSGAFDGVTAGFFNGSTTGTLIAGNLASGGTSDLINLQVGGTDKFKVTNAGNLLIWGVMQFGGVTSAQPALKRDNTELQVRLADDTAFAPFQASQLTIDAGDIITDTITGMKIGTGTTQKLGFWNATPIIQPISGGPAAVFVANTSLIADDSATFDGYTIGQVVKALRDMGILA